MDFDYSPRCCDLQQRLLSFMETSVYPNEYRFHEEVEANRRAGDAWVPTRLVEELKVKARAAGLWNLFLPHSPRVPEGLSNLDYAPPPATSSARPSRADPVPWLAISSLRQPAPTPNRNRPPPARQARRRVPSMTRRARSGEENRLGRLGGEPPRPGARGRPSDPARALGAARLPAPTPAEPRLHRWRRDSRWRPGQRRLARQRPPGWRPCRHRRYGKRYPIPSRLVPAVGHQVDVETAEHHDVVDSVHRLEPTP